MFRFRSVSVGVGVLAIALGAAACGSSGSSSSTTTSKPMTTTTMAQATTSTTAAQSAAIPCTNAVITAAVQASNTNPNTTATVNQYKCDGTYAYAFVDLTQTPGTSGGPPGIAVTDLLMWSGTSWAVVNRGTYCTNAVPADIYNPGCTTN